MFVGAGFNNTNAIGVPSDSKDAKWTRYVSKMTEILVDVRNISCVAAGWKHTLLVTKDGRVFAGDNRDFMVGSDILKKYEKFIEIHTNEERIVCAVAGNEFSFIPDRESESLSIPSKIDPMLLSQRKLLMKKMFYLQFLLQRAKTSFQSMSDVLILSPFVGQRFKF